MNANAISSTGADQNTRSSRQLPPTSGSTNGIVKMEASVAPTSIPLDAMALPSTVRCGTHSRTSAGSAGCMIAMPKPITIVAA